MSKDKYKIDKKIEQPKKKRIRRTREQLIADGYYDKKNNQNKGENQSINLQNNGKPKRHRRTKLEIELAREQTENLKGKNKDADRSHLFTQGGKTVEQISTQAIQKAQERGDANWEQDFRNDYEKGQKIYYVKINNLCHSKELLELYVGTIYSKVMVCWEDKGASYSIGIDDIDKIFFTEKEARKYYQKVRVENE